ncbi:MAG: GNAT family N-acetyltransferase [Proteobacteria bacterium]|nr:GNAT family N-acetyltransferase [Pseudomonadota bacterium]
MIVAAARRERPVEVIVGDLEARLAETEAEIMAAQELRYRVFYGEMGAIPSAEMTKLGRDFDSFDPYCDHLIVVDRTRGSGVKGIVATYRLLRREAARRAGRFYSIAEYDISPLVNQPGEILELGRSCVDPAYRNKMAMQLLWKGITDYILFHKVEVMFGCASFSGIDVQAHRMALSYLHHRHLAPPQFRPKAVADRYVDMNMMPLAEIDERRALASLPPLIKGYLRLSGYVGDGAVIDHEFGSVDVSIVVVTAKVTDKYMKHYTRPDYGGDS